MKYAKWLAIIALVCVVVTPVLCLSGCGFSQEEIDEAYQGGYEAGRDDGYEQAYHQYFQAGNAYLDEEQWDEAITEYTKAIELNPEFAEAYANRAVAYLEKYLEGYGAYDWVIADCEKAMELDAHIKLNARLALAYAERGKCFFQKGKYDQAVADYTRAMDLNPVSNWRTPVNIYYEIAERQLENQNYNEAIAYFRKAIELDLGSVDNEYYYRKLAEAYEGRGLKNFYCPEPDDAIADLGKAIELDPTNAGHYSARASTYSMLADYYWDQADYYWYQDEDQLFEEAVINLVDSNNKAIADFTKVIELAPERAEVYFSRGQCYAGNGDYIRAITDFTKAIELGREEWSVYFNRASAYKELGNKEKALIDYRKALALSSEGIWSEDDWLKEQILKDMQELQSD